MKKMLQGQLVQNVIKQLNISYLNDMLNYVLSTTQDETEPKAAQHLIKELIKAFLEEPARQAIMTFAEQLKEDYKQEFMSTLAQQLKQEGVYEVAKNLLAEGMSIELVKKVTKLPDLDLIELEKA